jgi:hypothetical protein
VSDVGHAVRIARVEVRRSLRTSFGTRRKLAYTLGLLLLFSPILLGWGRMAYAFGRTVAGGSPVPVTDVGVQLFALAAVFVAFAAVRVVQQGTPDGMDLLLTATSTRAVLLGTLAHQTLQLLTFVSVPLFVVLAGFSLGADAPSVVLAGLVLLFPLFTAVHLLGTVLGMAFSLGVLRSPLVRRLSQAIGLVVFLGILGLSFALTYPAAAGGPSPLTRLPVAWVPLVHYADLAFLGSDLGVGLSLAGLGSLLVVLGSIPVLFAIAHRLAPRLWFADVSPATLLRGEVDVDQRTAPATVAAGDRHVTSSRSGTFPRWRTPPSVGVASVLWVRWTRAPTRFATVVPLVGVLVSAGIGVASDPESLPVLAPIALGATGVYLTGVVFGLNPLGEAGAMRPSEVLSSRSSATFVRGHLVAGLVLGVPLTLAGTAALVVLNDVPLAVGVALGLVAPFAAGVSGCVALLLGTVFPQYEQNETFGGLPVASPSVWAILGHVFATAVLVALGAGPALAVSLVPGLRPHLLVGVVASLVVLSLTSGGILRLTVSRYDRAGV